MTIRLLKRASGLVLAAVLIPSLPRPAAAQLREPPGPFAADVRVAFPRFKDDVQVASALGVDSAALPGGGRGLVFGAHWYPVRARPVTLGIGGEVLFSRGTGGTESPDSDTVPPPPAGPEVVTRFSAVSPQVSLNFGTHRGWSYLTGGFGWGSYRTELAQSPVGSGDSRPRVFNYGGGARWFAKEHVAFALDLRFYKISEQPATLSRPAYGARTMMVFSLGASFK